MPKLLPNENNPVGFERKNSRESLDEHKNVLPKPMQNDEKREYDFKDSEVEDVEKLTNSKLLTNIGFGGFSTVKLIYNHQQKSYFAMKVVNLLNKKFKKKTPSKNRDFIYQEILVNFNARNSNIVKLYGYFNHKEYILLILEYMNNRDLKHFMKKFHSKNDSNFSELLTGFFIIQILKAMGYLKMRNILHRDIKPENVMLNNSYVAKLGDFSLSRKIDLNSNFKTSRSGTLPYLSPECVKKKISIKSIYCEKLDLFSLGVVMYFLLFNRHPFNYKNHMTCSEYSKILQQPTKPSFEDNNITDCCKSFLEGLLEKNYTKRFSFDRTMNHPWIVMIKCKIEEISDKFHSDPDKMISLLNNTVLTNDYFKEKEKDYKEIDVMKEESLYEDNMMNKKRKRGKSKKE